jgi:hypothetical protein
MESRWDCGIRLPVIRVNSRTFCRAVARPRVPAEAAGHLRLYVDPPAHAIVLSDDADGGKLMDWDTVSEHTYTADGRSLWHR